MRTPLRLAAFAAALVVIFAAAALAGAALDPVRRAADAHAHGARMAPATVSHPAVTRPSAPARPATAARTVEVVP